MPPVEETPYYLQRNMNLADIKASALSGKQAGASPTSAADKAKEAKEESEEESEEESDEE